ncbi:uncharacterized protein [Channa argus]|uniref:uncharacterized protein n=1 Tax=Channa argus TaxID=215402 RepID=UPI0035201CF8
MKSFLLLFLLMEGSEAPSKMKGCLNGWIEFICGYNNTSITKYHMIDVVTPKETLRSTQRDEWENKGKWFLYHDTTNQHLRVIFKQLQREDFGKQQCQFHRDSVSAPEITELELDMDDDNCQHTTFNHTTYTTAQTTILCTDKGNRVRFFCKDNGFICEDILSTTVKSNGSFSLTDNNSGFNMSISDVSSQDAGVYWCGVKPNQGNYRAALQRIQLEVQNISVIKRSSAVGQTLTYWCSYPEDAPVNKFICKGEDPYVCEQLVNILKPNMKTGKLSIEDDREERNITVTVRNLTAEDTGTYWCGAGTSDEKRRNQLFNKLVLTVETLPTVTTANTSNQSTTASAETQAGSRLRGVVSVGVLVVFILVLVYFCIKITNNKKDHVYAEIQEPPQKKDWGTAMKSTYVLANFPTNPSAFKHATETPCEGSSDEVNDKIYSTILEIDQCFTCTTVNNTPTSPDIPLYSTANLPQQDPPPHPPHIYSELSSEIRGSNNIAF